jgi:hypothetical protein
MFPELSASKEEKENFIKTMYACKADCDMCGLCATFHGKDPMIVFKDYIEGKREYLDILKDYR